MIISDDRTVNCSEDAVSVTKDFDNGEETPEVNKRVSQTVPVSFPGAFDGKQSLAKTYADIVFQHNQFVPLDSSFMDPFIDAVKNYTALFSQIDFQAITKALSGLRDVISRYVSNLRIPSISDERKQQLLESHRIWGEYGWTAHPNDKLERLFVNPPLDKKDADRKALQLCKDTDSLFRVIQSKKRVKAADFDEAIRSFDFKNYKSCALMLFALIDAQLIRFQRKSELQNKRRGVGQSAVLKAKDRIGVEKHKEWLFLAMHYSNLFACLEKVFESGKDFKFQPEVINRNFLNHGMLTRPVRKKDCIQLFLLYNNVLDMLDREYAKG